MGVVAVVISGLVARMTMLVLNPLFYRQVDELPMVGIISH